LQREHEAGRGVVPPPLDRLADRRARGRAPATVSLYAVTPPVRLAVPPGASAFVRAGPCNRTRAGLRSAVGVVAAIPEAGTLGRAGLGRAYRERRVAVPEPGRHLRGRPGARAGGRAGRADGGRTRPGRHPPPPHEPAGLVGRRLRERLEAMEGCGKARRL